MINYDFMVTLTVDGVEVDLLMFYAAESEEIARELLKTSLKVNKELSAGKIDRFEILE